MKKILITGVNGYVGNSFIKWIKKNNEEKYEIDTLSLRNEDWRNEKFKEYETILHLAAIVHSKNIDRQKYYKINKELTINLAKKAKLEGVKHFIFFSTLSVYGKNVGEINKSTIPNPINDYGKSKLEAENELIKLEDDQFKISIIRSPVIYGKNSPGNFDLLNKKSKYFRFFPDIKNKRSMIFIDNLSSFLNGVIEHQETGILHPQNKNYVSISLMISEIRKINKKDTTILHFKVPKFFYEKVPYVGKIFGDLTIDHEVSKVSFNYNEVHFKETIKKSI
ncbi:hypothetical protein ESP131_00050 [Exiguobacterium sp. U13-1]|uniref:NAD-dependent epimerase/dehydratase family protein n=1 Tax=Exiguobacterium sp. U13-1 TaxID=1849031 RepID=UPI0008595E65|nr:NAD-dependent epimerase/dehydratase family protein [Exiguobacterium sp. U13-1]AOS98782.1 hypothetical protein ESP131_00050 [Exiguobacterium sp. U13-1]